MRARALIVAASLMIASPPMWAQEDVEKEAKRLFIEAAKLVDGGKLDKALENYRAAYELVPRPKILLNMAAVLADLGRKAEQANVLQEYLDHPRKDARRARKVEASVGKLDKKLGRLELRIAAGGRVSVNGDKVADGPAVKVFRVRPGSHAIIARFETGTVAKEVTVGRGEKKPVELEAPEAKKPEDPKDGQGSGEPDKPITDPQPKEPASSGPPIYKRAWLYTMVGTAVAAGAGVYFGTQATSAEEEYNDLLAGGSVEFSEAKEIEDRGNRNATLANVAFISAGALAVASGVLLYFDLKSDGDGEQAVSVMPLSEGGAMVVRGWQF